MHTLRLQWQTELKWKTSVNFCRRNVIFLLFRVRQKETDRALCLISARRVFIILQRITFTVDGTALKCKFYLYDYICILHGNKRLETENKTIYLR